MKNQPKEEVLSDKIEEIHTDKPDISTKSEEKRTTKPMRQIIIETDGNIINIVKADVSGSIELRAIFENLIRFLNQAK